MGPHDAGSVRRPAPGADRPPWLAGWATSTRGRMTIAADTPPLPPRLPGHPHAFRTCPLCEAGCGLEITRSDGRRRGGHPHPRRPRRRVQPRLHLPEGLDAEAAPRGPRPAPPAAGQARRRVRRRRPGTRRSPRSSARPRAGHRGARPRRRRRLPRQPERPQPRRPCSTAEPLLRALGTHATSSRPAPSTSGPRRSSSALMFGGGLTVPVPDVDRTDHLLMLGANPFASNGSLATAPDWPGRIEAHPRARRPPRRRRPAPQPRPPRMADEYVADPPRHRRPTCSPRWCSVLARRGPRRPRRRSAELRRRARRRSSTLVAPFTAEVGRRPHRHRRRRRSAASPASWPPRRRAAVYGRIGTTHRRVRHARLAGWSTCSTSSPATSTGPAARCSPAPAAGALEHPGHARRRPGPRASAAAAAGCAACPSRWASSRSARLAEEIDTPGEGQIRALVTIAGNPVLSTPERAPGSTPRSTGLDFMVSIDIYVNETTRHADVILPSPSRAAEGPLRPRPPAARASATSPTGRRPVLPLDDGQPDEWEILARLALVAQGMGADADPAMVDDLVIDGAGASGASADEHGPVARSRRRGRSSPRWPRGTGPERHRRPACCAPGPTATGSARERPTALTPRRAARRTRTASTSAPLEPRLPDVLRTPSGMIELAPEPLLGRPAPGCADGARRPRDRPARAHRPPRPALEQLVDAQRRGAGEGHGPAARCTSTPTTPTRWAWSTASRRRVRSPGRRGRRCPSRSPTPSGPGVVSLPHGWGHDLPGVAARRGRPPRRRQLATCSPTSRCVDAAVGQRRAQRHPRRGRPAG